MITSPVTKEQLAHWRALSQELGSGLVPNRISGEALHRYFREKYCPEPLDAPAFSEVVRRNARDASGQAETRVRTYALGDVMVGLGLDTGFFHVECRDVERCVPIYDDLFLTRGLDEEELRNYVLVGQYAELAQKTPVVLYLHGQGGSAEEAAHYAPLFPKARVVGLAYKAGTPREAREELPALFDKACGGFRSVTLIANSIGAFFALCALGEKWIDRAFFISPVVDMERLILDMLGWAGKTETELRERGTIQTDFGQTLSWDYLTDVRAHPVSWGIPTHILYGKQDHLTSFSTISAFSERIGASLTVMDGGEHWFHTPAQMAFLDRWIETHKGV